jgi:hypothetical protein
MWQSLASLVVINISLAIFSNFGLFTEYDLFFLGAALLLIVALNANYWRMCHLQQNGYQSIGFVFADNSVDAKIKAVEILLDKNIDSLGVSRLYELFGAAILDPQSHHLQLKADKKTPYFTC